jgi:hypothetical protein
MGPKKKKKKKMLWYARELSQVVSLASPCTPSGPSVRPRADSLFPTPPSCGSSSKGPLSRMSKPLPALPGPYPQLDPTFPHQRQALPPPYPVPRRQLLRCPGHLRSPFHSHRYVHHSRLMSQICSTISSHGPSLCHHTAPALAPVPAQARASTLARSSRRHVHPKHL